MDIPERLVLFILLLSWISAEQRGELFWVQWIAGLEGTVAGLCFKVRKLFYLSTEHLPNKNTIWALEVNWFKAMLNY